MYIILLGVCGFQASAQATIVLDASNPTFLFEYNGLEFVGPASDPGETSLDNITFDISLTTPLPPLEQLPNITLTLYGDTVNEAPIIPATPLINSFIELDEGFSYFSISKLTLVGVPEALQDLQGLILFEVLNPINDFAVTLDEITIIQDSPEIEGRYESTFIIVPEPSSILLLAIGIGCLACLKRRKASPARRRLP
ncbi:MAG: PEP-CTERM sorting domain-containing protein [Verrucomicrobiota bacterium]